MKYRVTLTKLSSNHQNLRTDVVEGVSEGIPVVGADFFMLAPALEFGDLRAVRTTEVQRVQDVVPAKILEFWTRNSHYRLEYEYSGFSLQQTILPVNPQAKA